MNNLKLIASFCHSSQWTCPALYIDESAEASKQIVIRDDFSGEVKMSREQMLSFIRQIKDDKISI